MAFNRDDVDAFLKAMKAARREADDIARTFGLSRQEAQRAQAAASQAAGERARDQKRAAEKQTEAADALGIAIGGKLGGYGRFATNAVGLATGRFGGGSGVGGAARSLASASGASAGAAGAIGLAAGGAAAGAGMVAALAIKLIGDPLQKLAGSITDTLAPAALMAKAIASPSSGFAAFEKSTQVLGTVVSAVLLPAFALLGAAVLTVANELQGPMLAAVQGVYNAARGSAGPIGGGIEGVANMLTGGGYGLAKDSVPGLVAGGREKKPGFDANIRTILQEVRASIGPKAQTFGIADASRQAQMAALNGSPLEVKMLDIMTKILAAMENAVNGNREVAVTP